MSASRKIVFGYGERQKFRYRHGDINIIGRVDSPDAIRTASYKLNNSESARLYVEPKATDKEYPWNTRTPSVHRLRHLVGWFNIDMPIDAPALKPGQNVVHVEAEDARGVLHTGVVEFDWNPEPIPLPLRLNDLNGIQHPQEIGQAVNGLFDIDVERDVIRSRSPAGPDVLFLVGSPNLGQDATYDVRFVDSLKGNFIGLSDFFVRHEVQDAGLGIKPGYSTNGLATLDGKGAARIWIAAGDCLMDKEWSWVSTIENPPSVTIEPDQWYRVRHQVIWIDGINYCRWRIWRRDQSEPDIWLCSHNNKSVDEGKPRNQRSSFGLFKYDGGVTEWSNIEIQALESVRFDPNEPVYRQSRFGGFTSRLKRGIRKTIKGLQNAT